MYDFVLCLNGEYLKKKKKMMMVIKSTYTPAAAQAVQWSG